VRRKGYPGLAGFHVWLRHGESPLERAEQYPSYPALNDNIKAEAEAVVKRLRDHPSVVIFAGNNEDYQVAESLKVMDYSDESGDYMKSKFPAYVQCQGS
jgi:beta-mannosidase